MTVTSIGNGLYRVDLDGRSELVYVAGPPGNLWAAWNGQVFRGDLAAPRARSGAGAHGAHALTAPMPAIVVKLHVAAGDRVRKDDVIVVLEAMKIELPLRAANDALVAAVHCREGDMVTADVALVELEYV
jgi:3-methylcrotonyl-CoA carboxylase alpha subunit